MTGRKETKGRASAIAGEVMSEISAQKEQATVAETAERQRTGTSAIQDAVFILSMLSCLTLTGLNVTGKMPFQTSIATPSEAESQKLTLQTLNFAVRAIDAYRKENARLPRTLTEVGAPADSRWVFEAVTPDRYRVEFHDSRSPLAYDSINDPDIFFAEVRGLR